MILQRFVVKGAAFDNGKISQNSEQQLSSKSNNSKLHEEYLKEMCSTALPWHNPCGGRWVGNKKSKSIQSVPHHQALTVLKHTISHIYRELSVNTSEIKSIDTKDTWSAHKRIYRFLPRIKSDSKVKLRTWHRKAQIYVGAFNYLRRAQLYYDFKRDNEERSTARVLKKFKEAAMNILCEIETTINITSSHHHRSLNQIRSHKMRQILKFRTEKRHFRGETCTEEVEYAEENPPNVEEMDLRFAKSSFLRFLRSMRKLIKRKIADRTNLSSGSSSRSESNGSNKNSSDQSFSNNYSNSIADSSDSTYKQFDSNFSSDSPEINHVHSDHLSSFEKEERKLKRRRKTQKHQNQ